MQFLTAQSNNSLIKVHIKIQRDCIISFDRDIFHQNRRTQQKRNAQDTLTAVIIVLDKLKTYSYITQHGYAYLAPSIYRSNQGTYVIENKHQFWCVTNGETMRNVLKAIR